MLNWDDMAVVGYIARAHGRRGEVIVNLETDFPDVRFKPGAELFIRRAADPESIRLAAVRFQHDRPVIAIDGVDTMDGAEALAGRELRVPREWLAPLPAGMFYHHDLVGCRVETRDGAVVGLVSRVDAAAAGARLVVEANGGEVLIPLVQPICTTIDPEAKRIVIDPPEGLLDLNR